MNAAKIAVSMATVTTCLAHISVSATVLDSKGKIVPEILMNVLQISARPIQQRIALTAKVATTVRVP